MKIILYTTHCPMCRLVERKLKEKNIKYSTFEDKDEMIKKGFISVPVLQIDDKYYTGTQNILKLIDELK